MPARWSSVAEVDDPRVDQANTHDLGLLVTDGHAFFPEETRDAASTVALIAPGGPEYRVVNRCRERR